MKRFVDGFGRVVKECGMVYFCALLKCFSGENKINEKV